MTTLARRTAVVMVGVVLLAVVVAALVSVGLIRSAATAEARRSLDRQADVVAGLLRAGGGTDLDFVGAVRTVRREDTPVAWRLTPDGPVRGDPLARRALALAGTRTAATVAVDGVDVLVEVRTLPEGRLVALAQAVPTAQGRAVGLVRRELVALAVGLVVAVVVALAFAARLARPLRRTADAAGRLAAGDRSVRLAATGPREVADVAHAVNALAVALDRSEGRQREFLMSVSHELRTPLTAVRGLGESLADGVHPDPVAAGRTVVAESQRLERLVSDLLDLGRLGADRFRFERHDVDLAALVRDAGVVWRARADALGVDLRVEAPDGPLTTVTDPGRLRQVVDNLAENALRVTPAGRPVVLALRTAPADAYVEVRDGGPGLTDDDLAVVFERSALHDRYRGVRRVGTGIGLALVRALAEGLGGTAYAGRAPEGGTTVGVRLPRVAAE